ncbi:uncharacterized protein SPAPADRAFT_155857 [Spathaspora passalidarum NRRL Y-27907]|uniref:HECT-type E3 ubiquitin transferase n=1 Tax=Spathaspora passalidarum (strain NRRL Y-27907 / 11-Y1) TaxID=619300 RepID=G3ASM6_SPAPN|nr:uncharacterized protein SPAPADRAFT_155857 [Spathaspora passalidarum NRRL Y-27907]EGW30711.1 hypothetical protein SPAPADRAFT_155857 [Spathaspora passalidarum NRRL Y-27907]
MINFSGSSTKRRVVNLGDRKTPVSSRSFLEQSRITRIQRDQQRTQEKSAVTLQCYIRRYLDLMRYSQSLINESKQEVSNEQEWIRSIKINIILCKWYIPSHKDVGLIQTIYSKLDQSGWALHENLYNSLLQALIGVFILIFQTIKLLMDKFNSDYNMKVANLTSYLYKFLHQSQIQGDQKQEVLDMIYAINIRDSFENFIQVLKLTYPGPNINYLNILRPIILQNQEELGQFEELDLIQMLASYLAILGSVDYTKDDFVIIAALLVNTNCIVGSEVETDDNDSQVDQGRIVHVDKSVVTQLEKLYTSNFIKSTITLLTGENNSLALKILLPLITLIPSLTGKISMFISIIPDCFYWFYQTIQGNEIFDMFLNSDKDYIPSEQLETHSNDKFWKLVLLFEKSYSYWLIVSNDLESFADDKLSLIHVKQYLKFLRTLCLTLVFNNNFPHYSELKQISIGLLNQLYLKNLRLKFLNQNFWIPRSITFDIDVLIRVVAEEEVQDSDEEEPKFSVTRTVPNEVKARVEILKTMPFFISFKDRVRIFQALIELDRMRASNTSFNFFSFDEPARLSADIRRENLLVDAFNAFNKSGASFKNRIQVVFYNEYGQEAGIDGGGITKEFLTSVVKEGFNPENELKLFKETLSHNQLYPNNDIYDKLHLGLEMEAQQVRLQYLRFLGMVVGKCFYENVLIDISFAPFFLNKWCNMKNSINDLNYLDSELFVNLMKLTKMTNEELEALDLNFTIYEKVNQKTYLFDLAPNGQSTQVNSSNILQYIHQLSNFKLNQSLTIQTRSFLQGLFSIISSNWLNMFDCFELQMLISGEPTDVNINDWKLNVEYGGYLENDLTIKYFWQVVEEMTKEQRFKLIKFVTSVGRVPLLGFGSLNPKFGLRNSGRDGDRLPTASTCVNLLKLPDYQNKQILKEKLLYAISIDSGFDLS